MLVFTYQWIHDKINLIKISQGSSYEKSNFNDDIRFARRDYL